MTTHRRRALLAGLPGMLAACQCHAQTAHMTTRHPDGGAGDTPAPDGAAR